MNNECNKLNDKELKPPEIFYHYTSLDTLEKIIISKKIRLYNSVSMNDYTEGRWIEQYFDEIIDENEVSNSIINKFYDIYEFNRDRTFRHIFSLSVEKGLLSQWTRYADDGLGICIGFNMKNIKIPIRVPVSEYNEFYSLGFFPIIYNHDLQYKIVKEEIVKINNNSNDIELLGIVKNLIEIAIICKSDGFREENEWRIINTPTSQMGINKEVPVLRIRKPLTPQLQYDISQNYIRDYSELDFSEIVDDEEKIISEIIIGPKSKVPPIRLKQYLMGTYGLEDIIVSKSKIPYRGK